MNAYCVILCRRSFESEQGCSRTKRCYVGESTAALAILAASELHPQYRPIGIEPSDLPICA
jgi:hypothetical protein